MSYGFCIHKVNIGIYRCPECVEVERQEKREERLYAILDNLADAIRTLTPTTSAERSPKSCSSLPPIGDPE